MIRRSTLIAAEIVAALTAALLIALGVAWWRLSQGPVELSFIAQHIEAELSEARAGRPVGIEGVELNWSREANALELRALGVSVEDAAGNVLSRSDEARIELAVLPLLVGRVSVARADFSGGALTVTRKLDGAVHVAFGPPGAPPDIIIPPPPPNETLEARVARLLDGLEEALAPVGPGARLKSLSARNVQLAIIDDGGGGRWTSDAASFTLGRQGKALELAAEARLEAARGAAPANLRITTDTAFQAAIVEFGASDVRPRALLSEAALGPFAGLDAPLTAAISIGLDRKIGITSVEGHATLGEGAADMAGDRFELDGGSVRGRYDIETDELIIDQLHLAGAETRLNGQLRLRDASALMRAAPDAPAAFDISLPAVTLDVPGVFAAPVNLADVEAAGMIDLKAREVRVSRLRARSDQSRLQASGRLYWARAGADRRVRAGVALDGAVEGPLSARAVMGLWPIGVGEGARRYLADAIVGGELSNTRVKLDIRPSDIAAEQWRNEAVDVRFDYAGANFKFVSTMSAIEAGRGSAILRGNRFDLTMEEGRLNGLALSRGRVEIPRFKPRGALATYAAHAEGDARRMIEVLLQEPLALADRLPVAPESVSGHGAVDLVFQRPMQTDVAADQLRYTVDGRLENVAANMSARRIALSRGRLSVRGDQRAIHIVGPIRAGRSDISVQWTERGQEGGSEYQVSGDFDADDLERLGYPVAAYAQGRIGVVVSGEGRGFDVDNANVQLDLRRSAVEAPFRFWTKNAGEAASASFDVARLEDGGLRLSNINARGAGLVAQGETRLTRDNRIAHVELTRLAVEGRSDARLTATLGETGAYAIRVAGDLFDAAPFMDNSAQPPAAAAGAAGAPPTPPVHADVAVARLKMRGGATLADAEVALDVAGGALTRLSASGRAPGGDAFALTIGPRPGDVRSRIALSSDDAGFAMRALTGADNVVGGVAVAEGVWRPGPPASADFNVRLRDFQVVRLPAMTRLLSSAGSLTGLVEMLNGDGIGFSSLDASLAFSGDDIRVVEARAAGPSLGLTAAGAYDMARNDFDIDGVVVPSYGLNSMLGAVPILGDLFVSRRGEGVFGMTYSINGAAETPRVGVNPLSALTPGILRRIFEPVQDQGAAPNARGRATAALPASEGGAAAPAN